MAMKVGLNGFGRIGRDFVREYFEGEVEDFELVAINADENSYTANFDASAGCADDIITGCYHDFGGGSVLEPYSAKYWKLK